MKPHHLMVLSLTLCCWSALAVEGGAGPSARREPEAGDLADGDAAQVVVTTLRVLGATGDRARPRRARFPEYQANLDAISTPHSRRLLRDALADLWTACAAPGEAPAAAKLTRLADLWHLAEVASYAAARTDVWCHSGGALAPLGGETHPGSPLPRWEAVLGECRGTPLAPVARLVLGQWLQYRGAYGRAAAMYDEAEVDGRRVAGLAAWLAFERGELAVQTGRLEEAVGHYGRCAEAQDRTLAAEATVRLAECHECLGQWGEAAEVNRRLGADGTLSPTVRRRAEPALSRLADARKRPPALQDGPVARYLGQDRRTQGDWQWRGRDQFILCGASCPADISGGSLGRRQYEAWAGETGQRAYRWLSGGDGDAGAPVEPTRGRRRVYYWSDGGRRREPATGPDLLAELAVPDGEWNLALYFGNDPDRYAADRGYTVHLTDGETGGFLAAAPVRDLVCGVYVLFRVTGPRMVRVRVWRNLSPDAQLTGVFLDAVTSLPAWPALTAPRGDMAGAEPAWERFRTAFADAADGPTQRDLLEKVGASVCTALGALEGGRALETPAARLAEEGFVAQSIVLQDAALGALSHGSRRQYAAALRRTVLAYGARRATCFHGSPFRSGSQMPRAMHQGYALARAADYSAQIAEPAALVAPEDLLQLAHELRGEEVDLARECFLLAVDGDLTRLPSADLWAYAYCLRDEDARADTLAEVLRRGEPLPRSEAILRLELVSAYCHAGRLDEAEAQMEPVMAGDLDDRSKGDTALSLASHSDRLGDRARARRWAKRIVSELPTSPAAARARRLLSDMGG